jgi:hypothetical protein
VVSSLSLKKAPQNVTALEPSVLILVKMPLAAAVVGTSLRMSKVKSSVMSVTLATVPGRPSTIAILVVAITLNSLALLMVSVSKLTIVLPLALLDLMALQTLELVPRLSECVLVTTSLQLMKSVTKIADVKPRN